MNARMEEASRASITVPGKLEGPLTRQRLWVLQEEPGRTSQAEGFPEADHCPLLQVVNGIEVYSTKISCKVTSRFAHNVVTTRAVNRADTAKEVSFDVELPKTAFITNFTLWVSPWPLVPDWGVGVGSLAQPEPPILLPCRTIDGVTYPGNVKEKEVAKKQYEKAVSQGKTAGLVK